MIEFKGYITPATLNGINSCLLEHGFPAVSGVVLDDGFVPSELEMLSDEMANLIANTFAPTSTKVLGERAETERQRRFADYDTHALMYQREVRLGVSGAAEKLAAWDAYAEALRAINDTPDWYLSPQWPTPPEV